MPVLVGSRVWASGGGHEKRLFRWGYWGRGPRGTCDGVLGEEVGYGGDRGEGLIVPEREAGGQR